MIRIACEEKKTMKIFIQMNAYVTPNRVRTLRTDKKYDFKKIKNNRKRKKHEII